MTDSHPVVVDHDTGEVLDATSVAGLPALRATTSTLVRPVATLEDTEQAFLAYMALCDRIITKDDVQTIGGKEFRKKSGWRKLSVAFGVSCELKERIYERTPNGRIARAEVVVRATAPNGRFMDGLGACDLYEKCCPPNCRKKGWRGHTCCDPATCTGVTHFSNPQHDIPATAHTRATNRACADLFGMGEVSAEEVTDATRGPATDDEHQADPEAPPISQENRDELLSAMNSMTTDGDARAKLKQSFARRFGSPANLTQPNLDNAWKFLASRGIKRDAADPGRPFEAAPKQEGQEAAADGPESASSAEPGAGEPEAPSGAENGSERTE